MKAKRPKKKTQPKQPNLEQMVAAAHAAGMHISFSMEPNVQMPQRLPNDPEHVVLLLDESERVSQLGNKWLNAKVPNPVAADKCFSMGWAYALAAAHLRCRLNGQIGPDVMAKENKGKDPLAGAKFPASK